MTEIFRNPISAALEEGFGLFGKPVCLSTKKTVFEELFPDEKAKRIAKVSSLFLSLYTPFAVAIYTIKNSVTIFQDLKEIKAGFQEGDKQKIQAMLPLASLTAVKVAVFAVSIAILKLAYFKNLNLVCESGQSLYESFSAFQGGDYKAALEKLLWASYKGLNLTVSLSSVYHILACALLIKVVMETYKAHSFFTKFQVENDSLDFLESTAHFFIASRMFNELLKIFTEIKTEQV